jgi:hypothetical protein
MHVWSCLLEKRVEKACDWSGTAGFSLTRLSNLLPNYSFDQAAFESSVLPSCMRHVRLHHDGVLDVVAAAIFRATHCRLIWTDWILVVLVRVIQSS